MTISKKIENHADPNGAFICIKRPIEIHGRNAFTLPGSYQTLVSVRRLKGSDQDSQNCPGLNLSSMFAAARSAPRLPDIVDRSWHLW